MSPSYTDEYGNTFEVKEVFSFVFHKGLVLSCANDPNLAAGQIRVSVPSMGAGFIAMERLSLDEAARTSVEIDTDADLETRLVLVSPAVANHDNGSVSLGFLMAPVGRHLSVAEKILNEPYSNLSGSTVMFLDPASFSDNTERRLLDRLDKMTNGMIFPEPEEVEEEVEEDSSQLIFSWE